VTHLSQEKEIKKFDPFEILEVTAQATPLEIKKSYRRLSLIYHPDKNPDDPLSASRFIQITKAHQALTDEVAKANYEKYGNPDGPQTTKVGIGLPLFLLERENHTMILCTFFFVLLGVVPMTFITYYQRTKNYAPNGVLIETLQFLGFYIAESTRVKCGPGLLAASAESRNIILRSTDEMQLKPLMERVVEHKKRQFDVPIIKKNECIVWAHMQRLHSFMTPELKADCDQMLKHSMSITQSMIEIACMREWFPTAQAMIEFKRCLVQALDVKSSQLLQIPHVTEEILKNIPKSRKEPTSLQEFLAKDAKQRSALLKVDGAESADVEAFCQHVSDLQLTVKIEVEDEPEIVVGDIATLTVQMVRNNLKEGEAIGPVHAPFFPETKFEEWWLFLIEMGPSARIITYERIRNTDRFVEAKMRFQVARPGPHHMVVHCLCDSYNGIDQKEELKFIVKQENEVNRELIIHKEDEELDRHPTLVQQLLGDTKPDEESEEEEEEEKKGVKGRAPAKSQVRSAGDASGDDESSDSSSSEE